MKTHKDGNMVLDRVGEKPLYRQVENYIEQMITTKSLKLGDRVPSPNVISKELSVNELTVRKAIKNLIHRHVLVSRQGRGTFLMIDPSVKKVLCVCGVDVFGGNISPYFMYFLRKCRQECLKLGMDLDVVWLSDKRPEEAHLYCNEDYLRKFKGFFFMACKVSHPLLTYVQSQKRHYVHITHEAASSYRVGVDYEHGLKLALDQLVSRGHERLVVFYISDIRSVIEKVTASYSTPIELVECKVAESLTEYEIQGYQRMCELATQDRLAKGILITDDILARGATRALLEKKSATCNDLDILIMVGCHEIIPLGVPVSYVTFDTEEQTKQAVKILNDQIMGKKSEQNFFVGHYKYLSDSSQPMSVS